MKSGKEPEKSDVKEKESKGSAVEPKKKSTMKSKKKSVVEQKKKSEVEKKSKKEEKKGSSVEAKSKEAKSKEEGKSKEEEKPKKGSTVTKGSTIEARSKESNGGGGKKKAKKGSTVETRTKESNDGGGKKAEKRKKGSTRTRTSTKTTVTTSAVIPPKEKAKTPTGAKKAVGVDAVGTPDTGVTPARSTSKGVTTPSPVTPGYDRRVNRSSEYKGSCSSDEKKKFEKFQEERRRKEEERRINNFSPEFLIGFMIFSVITAISLIATTWVLFQKHGSQEHLNRTQVFAPQTARRVMVVMSDNLDCSLYMKRQTMQMVDLREVALAGLQCLYINEPHSVAPDAGISILIYYSQEKRAVRNNRNLGYLKEGLSCKLGAKNHTGCDLRSYIHYYSSLVNLSPKNFGEKEVNSVWMRNGAEAYKKRYKDVFRKLSRFEDNGPPVYEEVQTTVDYEPHESGVRETRVFQVSKQFERMIKATAKRKPRPFSYEYSEMFNITSSSKRSDRIIVTKSLARNVVHNFLYSKRESAKAPRGLNKIRLHMPNKLFKFAYSMAKIPYVLFPKGSTHSIFAAFVFATVYDAAMRESLENHEKSDWKLEEHQLYIWAARAQKLAMHYFVRSREWTGKQKDISMFKRVLTASRLVTKELPSGLLMPTKKHVDRSASIVLWQRNDTDEIHIVNTALPKLFGSRHISGRTRLKFDRFEVELGGKTLKSVPFMSTTSLIIMEQTDNDPLSANPQYVVTSSGSVRNVEGVAMTTLLATLMNYPPGKVTWSPSFYLDIRDGKFYCDMGYSQKGHYGEHSKAIYEKVQEETDLSCEPLKRTELLARDRLVMFAGRPDVGKKKYYTATNTNKYMWASMDPRADDYNYAAGY